MSTTATGILLSGHSSAGKTSLARALQRIVPDPWHFLTAESLSSGYPRERTEFVSLSHERQLGEGCVRAARAFLDAGLNVIYEQGLWDPVGTELARSILGPINFLVVGVGCPPEVAEARELARGDVFPGTARQQIEQIALSQLDQDIAIDSTTMTPDELARELAQWLAGGPRPRALR